MRERPLSPHLSIYRPAMVMLMSIAHRITGIILYGAMLLFTAWLLAGASGGEAFATAQGLARSWVGIIAAIGALFALYHHLLGGIRHLLWDFGYLMGPRERQWLAQATLIGSLTLTALTVLVVALLPGEGP